MYTFERRKSVRRRGPVEVRAPAEGDAVWFARERLGFEPDERQVELLRCDAKQGMLNCSRQWGKSTMAAIKAVHRAVLQPESLVIVSSPAERQSAEFLMKAEHFVMKLGFPVRGDGHNRLSIQFPNGSRVVGLPGTERTARGYTANLLIIDEASRVEDVQYTALRPMLANTNGSVWLLSTPWGKKGFFWEQWEHGGKEWARFRTPVTECSRISAEWLASERKQMVDAEFRREYLCEFMPAETQMFETDLVRAAIVPDEAWKF